MFNLMICLLMVFFFRIFNWTEIDFINNNITLGYILSKVTNLRVEGQRDRNGNVVSSTNADIQADPFVHRGPGRDAMVMQNPCFRASFLTKIGEVS